MRRQLITAGMLAIPIRAESGLDFIGSLPFEVITFTPKTHFASEPPMNLCNLELLDILKTSLQVSDDQWQPFADQITELLGALKSPMATSPAALEESLPQAFEESRSQQNSPHFLQMSGGARLKSALDSSLRAPSSGAVDISILGVIGKQLHSPDMLTGFLSSRLIGEILRSVVGTQGAPNDADRSEYNKLVYIRALMDSPMKNLGEALCNAVQYSEARDFDPDWIQCVTISLVAAFMGCDETEPVGCANLPPNQIPEPSCSLQPNFGNWTFTLEADETLAIDNNIVKDDIIAQEGFSYYLLFRACLAASQWVSQSQCGQQPDPLQLVPGWSRVLEVWQSNVGMTEYNKHSVPKAIPGNSLSKLYGQCEFLFVQRGTANNFEWYVNFQAQQEPLPEDSSIMAHRGYIELTNPMISAYQHWLSENVFTDDTTKPNRCAPEKTRFTFTGHSLGGGVTEVLALRMAKLYKPQGVTFQSVTFAPAHGLDAAGIRALKSLVTTRSVLNELDLVPKFPCANEAGLPRCVDRYNAGIGGGGRDKPYGQHPNQITIFWRYLMTLEARFGSDSFLDVLAGVKGWPPAVTMNFNVKLPGPLQFDANHVCAYGCFTSQYCGPETQEQCLSICGWS